MYAGIFGEGVSTTTEKLEGFEQQGPGAGECDRSFPDVYICPIEGTGDLDCGQVDFRRFKVLLPGPHGFDSQGDCAGCKSD